MRQRRAVVRVAAIAAVSLLVAGGCNRFASSDEGTAVEREPVVGSTLAPSSTADTTSSTAAARPEVTTVEVASPSASPPTSTVQTSRVVVASDVANRSIVDHPGWRVTLTVGDRAQHAVGDEVLIEVVLANTSDHERHHQIEQHDAVFVTTFGDDSRTVWSSGDCNPTLDVYEQEGGLRALAAGDSIRVLVRYPLTDECRLPAGDYVVFGQWIVCPDDARRETANPGTFVCEDGRAGTVDAGPVPLRLS